MIAFFIKKIKKKNMVCFLFLVLKIGDISTSRIQDLKMPEKFLQIFSKKGMQNLILKKNNKIENFACARVGFSI